MLGYRFIYGFRLVTPLVLGAFGVARLRFLAFNLVNAAVWSALIASLGYAFGEVATRLFAEAKRYELVIVILLALVGLGSWLFHRTRERRRRAATTEPAPPESHTSRPE